MKLFGPLHLTLLAVTLIVAAGLAIACRRGVVSRSWTRFAIGGALAVNEWIWWAYRYSHEGIHRNNLPFQLCDALVWLAVIGCFTLIPTIVELAYFAGIAGAGMAMLTPDLYAPWPAYQTVYFFIAHGGITIAVLVLTFGGFVEFRPGAVWRSFGWLLGYAFAVGCIDAILGSNYMYLRAKPGGQSLLDRFGPWPWYLVGGAIVAMGIFWLLWLPVRPEPKVAESASRA